ncbi:RNA polymerase ECF family sigma subunit [Amycolatopsis sulphurea]|uniref:RNA polymerase ECF family sigma subunit n=1 Tax=Amycolatopsis sulphurea TaxID=76022 RepID=A0A2A9G414_9PSEU|nr:RNA polymerase subunit sigma-70 [Amycolatopsis sulphurea]PFG57641.1 RNA polymerase ECF family sigma subunit [Amycolatopsis sulphurea]
MTGMEQLIAADPEFAARADQHRRELHVHCYRMLGSFEDADDAVQDTMLRAWRSREQYEDGTNLRAWLYRVATTACLDAIRRRGRQVPALTSFAEVPWLQPYPDRLLDEAPEEAAVARETIELGFLAVLQFLPPQQRAVFILREVLDWPAAETATLLESSVPSVNSALQRARATMRDRLPARSAEWVTDDPTTEERELVRKLARAHEECDTSAFTTLIRDDVRVTMPPNPDCYDGLASMAPLHEIAFGPDRMGDWRLVTTRANRQPTLASYLRRPGDTVFRAFKLDVMRMREGKVAEFTTFDATLFPAFGLAATY